MPEDRGRKTLVCHESPGYFEAEASGEFNFDALVNDPNVRILQCAEAW